MTTQEYLRQGPMSAVVQWMNIELSTKKTWVRILCSWASFLHYTVHSSSLSYMNEFMAIDSGGYSCKQLSRINYSVPGCFPEETMWC